MRLAPKNQLPIKNNQMNNLSSSMAKCLISSPSTTSKEMSNSQIKSLRMPFENEIKQVHLNIKLGNRQPSEALRQKHGMECHYCKSQGLVYLGHWVSTCPVIREILNLQKAPPSMMGFEPAIRAVSENRTAGLVDTGSQVHVSGNSDFFILKEPLERMLALNLVSPSFHINATHRGKMKLPFINSEVNNVLFCKDIPGTLISLGQTGDKTPLELWCGRRPQPKRLFPFGAKAVVHIPTEKRGKLDDRGRVCQLIGFQDDSQGYFFWDNEKEQVLNSNYVKFLDFYIGDQSDKMKITNLINKVELRLGQENTEEICNKQDSMIDSLPSITDMEIPTNIAEAKKLDWTKWEDAIQRELNSFADMNVWTPVEKRRDMKIIKTKFIFDLKRKGNPEELVYKARLVARGFCQRYGIDCEHTYAPTASLTSLRLLLAMALRNGWKTATFDVSVAYLHSPIAETIFVEAPVEFRPEWEGKVMQLNKAMYGLKQAGHFWWQHFRSIMGKIGFEAEELDQCVYKYTKEGIFVYVWMHVDDGVIFSNNNDGVMKLKNDLMKYLKIRWENGLSRIVGIDISCSENKIILSQSRFANQVVNHFEEKARTRLLMNKTTLPEWKLETTRYSTSPQEEHWQALRHLLGQQKLVATSTCAAELVAIGMTTDLLSFILQILDSTKKNIHVTLICDNKAAVMVLEGSKTRIKSLERHFYSINDLTRKYNIKLEWTSTTNQSADICTKRLGPTKHCCNCKKLLDGD
ncbi:hypothetical protein O181_077892 [Austropuccinia psidii MF-1]|uniref:Reverse transcriptase Ty1/copia-type domain-containing protein n=1 Tax=Austropuccinia psidii MF-1 TaxID=1389203 RepID=A0A9Q3FGU3_9BASI|nr:hypothetical protein [Austropuccinia psidii MF-1]